MRSVSQIIGLLSVAWYNVRTKFEVRSCAQYLDNRGTRKVWTVPVFALAPFSPKNLMTFVRMDPMNASAKFEARSFIRS